MDWFQKVAEGRVEGYSTIEKFGENPSITTSTDPADIWDGGGLYNFSTDADIDRLSSSDDGDTQLIVIYGLDSNWEESIQFITLTGQTPTPLTTSLIRVYRMINLGTTDIAGDVYCFVNGAVSLGIPDDLSDVRAMIRNGNNQTLMAIYTIPGNKTGYLYSGYISLSRSSPSSASAEFTARARPYGGVFSVKARTTCISTGNSSWERNYPFPAALPPRTDILLRCEVVSASIGASGGYTLLLRDE